MKLKYFILISLFSIKTQCTDTRELPVQATSAGTVLFGIHTMVNLQPNAFFRNIMRIPMGFGIMTCGIVGLCYTPKVLKAADTFYDHVAEDFYKQKINDGTLSFKNVTNYMYYKVKNRGNFPPKE